MRTYLLITFITLGSMGVDAQKMTIMGMVTTAADGLPLPGANVIIKGTQTGAHTDFDGKYSIVAKKGDVLWFSFIGLPELPVGPVNA